MSSSESKDIDPSDTNAGPTSLDHINPKLGSMYFRFSLGEGLRYTTTDAFLAWKALPSTKSSTASRPFYIFLHDYGSSSRIFNNVVSRMPNFCLAVDLKGWGRSDDTKDEENRAYSLTQMKNQIRPIVSLLQGERFLLASHGMGAKVAQLYASQHPPKNLIGLVLLAPIPLTTWQPTPQIMEKYKAAYTKRNADRNLKSFIKTTLASHPLHDADLRMLLEDGTKDTPLAKEAWLTYGMQEVYASSLGKIKVPLLLRAGVEDKVIPLEEIRAEFDGQDKPRLGLAKDAWGCGHLVPLEDERLPNILAQFGWDAEALRAGGMVVEVQINEMDLPD